jgi:hypothetical protein
VTDAKCRRNKINEPISFAFAHYVSALTQPVSRSLANRSANHEQTIPVTRKRATARQEESLMLGSKVRTDAHRTMKFLITNDDGIDAAGLNALLEAAQNFGEATVVAPAAPQSGVSHAWETSVVRPTQSPQ